MCISAQALVSGLVLRIERDGHVPEAHEIAALLALGCRREELRRTFAERLAARPDRAFARAIELLDQRA